MSALLAYDASGNVIGCADVMVAIDEAGNPIGRIDFDAHEAAGGEHTDIWRVDQAKGSKVWPEHLGGRVHEFRVELEGEPGHKRIAALVHQVSGHRRERSAINEPGTPSRPLHLDETGRTAEPIGRGSPAHLPVL